jgi:hypothetical protein
MTKEVQVKCQKLMDQYQNVKGKRKQLIRNQLYFELEIDLIKWIRSILKLWGKNCTDIEIRSLSWHCYYHGLELYKKREVPLPFHFYLYSKYYLYREFILEKHYLNVFNDEKVVFNPDLSIKEIYDKLPKRVQLVMMDILTHQNTNKTKGSYYIHKKILKKSLRSLYL